MNLSLIQAWQHYHDVNIILYVLKPLLKNHSKTYPKLLSVISKGLSFDSLYNLKGFCVTYKNFNVALNFTSNTQTKFLIPIFQDTQANLLGQACHKITKLTTKCDITYFILFKNAVSMRQLSKHAILSLSWRAMKCSAIERVKWSLAGLYQQLRIFHSQDLSQRHQAPYKDITA